MWGRGCVLRQFIAGFVDHNWLVTSEWCEPNVCWLRRWPTYQKVGDVDHDPICCILHIQHFGFFFGVYEPLRFQTKPYILKKAYSISVSGWPTHSCTCIIYSLYSVVPGHKLCFRLVKVSCVIKVFVVTVGFLYVFVSLDNLSVSQEM